MEWINTESAKWVQDSVTMQVMNRAVSISNVHVDLYVCIQTINYHTHHNSPDLHEVGSRRHVSSHISRQHRVKCGPRGVVTCCHIRQKQDTYTSSLSMLTIIFITHATCKVLPTFVFPKRIRVLKYFRNVSFSAFLLEFPQQLRDVTVKYLSNAVADGDLKAVWNQGKFLTDQMFTSVLFHWNLLLAALQLHSQHCCHFWFLILTHTMVISSKIV